MVGGRTEPGGSAAQADYPDCRNCAI